MTSLKGAEWLEKRGVEHMQIMHSNDGNKHLQFYKDPRVKRMSHATYL